MTLVDDTALDTEERHYMAYVRRCREQGTEPLVPKEYHAHYTPEPANAGLWFRSDLEPVIERILDGTASTPMPTVGMLTDGKFLFYPGRINALWGESGSGKTWAGLIACQQELDAGNAVLFLDFEDNEQGTVSRLLALGVKPTTIVDAFIYFRPELACTDDELSHLAALIEAHDITTVVIDSTGESMALQGLRDRDDEVSLWFRTLPGRLARLGPAVIVLDHVTKDRETRGLYAIGSQRKRAAISGAAYMVDAVKAFGRGRLGIAKLTVAKDRHGTYAQGTKVAELVIDATVESTIFAELRPVEATDADQPFRPTVLMERISRYVEINPGLSARAVVAGVTGNAQAKRLALELLVSEGYIAQERSGQTLLNHSVKPFREHENG